MLLRVVRLMVVGAAVLLTLHLFMLAGHGQARHGPMGSPAPATHTTLPMDQPVPPALDHHTAMPAGVDMAATCFAVLAALLLLGIGVRRCGRVWGWLGLPASSLARQRARPLARSPVELCVSRT